MTPLLRCKPETRFAVCGRTGVLIHVSESRALVRWDNLTAAPVSITRPNGTTTTFIPAVAGFDSIAPGTEVEVLE